MKPLHLNNFHIWPFVIKDLVGKLILIDYDMIGNNYNNWHCLAFKANKLLLKYYYWLNSYFPKRCHDNLEL